MFKFYSNSGTFSFKLGCLATIAYLVIFFYYFPTSKDSFLYVILWIIGFFTMPTIISFIFGAGTLLGVILSAILGMFGIKKKEPFIPYKQEEQKEDTSTYINIDKYNKPDTRLED